MFLLSAALLLHFNGTANVSHLVKSINSFKSVTLTTIVLFLYLKYKPPAIPSKTANLEEKKIYNKLDYFSRIYIMYTVVIFSQNLFVSSITS